MKGGGSAFGLGALLCVALLGCSNGAGDDGSPILPTPVPNPAPQPNPPPRAPLYGIGLSIQAGQTVMASVERTDPACFSNWDSSGACKTYLVTAPRDGRLKAVLKWTPPPSPPTDVMDLFLVAPNASWVVSFEGTQEEVVEIPVTQGLVYSILVMSVSRSPQSFQLLPTIE